MGKTKKKSTKPINACGSNKKTRGKMFLKTTGLQRVSQNGNVLLNRGYTATLDDTAKKPFVIKAYNNNDSYNLSVSENELDKFINDLLSNHVQKKSLADRLQRDFNKIHFTNPNDLFLYKGADAKIEPLNIKYLPGPPRKHSNKKKKVGKAKKVGKEKKVGKKKKESKKKESKKKVNKKNKESKKKK